MITLSAPHLLQRGRAAWERMENPVLGREFRARMRGSRSYMITAVFTLVVMAGVLLAYWWATTTLSGPLNRKMAEAGRALWTWGCLTQAVLLPLMVPAFTCGGITIERERDLLELLLLTRQSALQICLGKLFSGVGLGLTLVLSSVPVLSLALFLGGLSPAEIAKCLCVLVTSVIGAGALGLATSSLAARTVSATAMAYVVIGSGLIGVPVVLALLDAAHRMGTGTLGEWGILAMLLFYVGIGFPPALGSAFMLALGHHHRTGALPPRLWWLITVGAFWCGYTLTLYLPGVSDTLLYGRALLALHPVVAILGVMNADFASQDPLLPSLWSVCSLMYLLAAAYCFGISVARVRRMRAA